MKISLGHWHSKMELEAFLLPTNIYLPCSRQPGRQIPLQAATMPGRRWIPEASECKLKAYGVVHGLEASYHMKFCNDELPTRHSGIVILHKIVWGMSDITICGLQRGLHLGQIIFLTSRLSMPRLPPSLNFLKLLQPASCKQQCTGMLPLYILSS